MVFKFVHDGAVNRPICVQKGSFFSKDEPSQFASVFCQQSWLCYRWIKDLCKRTDTAPGLNIKTAHHIPPPAP